MTEGRCEPVEGEPKKAEAPAQKPASPPKAGPFPTAPAKRDLEAFALYHRLQEKTPGTDPGKAVARRLKMTEEEASAALSTVAAYENDVRTWFERKIGEGEENPYGGLVAVSYVYRRGLLEVDFQNKAQHATGSAKSLVKFCLTAGALVAWRAVYDKAVTAPVKTVTIRVKQRNHETNEVFVAASADVKREAWEALLNSGRFSVAAEKADLLSPRYSPWMDTP